MQNDGMKKRHNMLSGKIEEIIYAQLKPGEDLLRALWEICSENDVRTGILLDATGSLDGVRVKREPHEPRPGTGVRAIDYAVVDGPLHVSAHGLIGTGWVPDESVKPSPELVRGGGHTGFGPAGFAGHKSPYFLVHITVTSPSQTVCGHLLEGSPVSQYANYGKDDMPSDFTVAIAKVSGVVLKATLDKSGFYHELVAA
ncbi:hypothetical protein ACVIWU_006594 [Bradyrhizobium sp. USDA 4509]